MKTNPSCRGTNWPLFLEGSSSNYHATKAEAQLAIETRREDERVAERKVAGTQVYPPETPEQRDARLKELYESYCKQGEEIQRNKLTKELLVWMKYYPSKCFYAGAAEEPHDVRAYDFSLFDFATLDVGVPAFWTHADAKHDYFLRTWKGPLTDEAKKKLRKGDAIYYADKEGVVRGPIVLSSDSTVITSKGQYFLHEDEAKAAAHDLWLADGRKNQMAPITPEQAKMLRVGDEFFYLQHGGGAPKYHVTLDKLKRSPDITKWKCFVNGLAYFTNEAALDKNKGVGSHETPKSETQHKEVVTDETQKPTTVRGWLETIPDPAIREAAIRQCALPYKTCYVLCDAIASMRDWAHTEEGVDFWDNCYFAAKHNDSWPTYPPKEKQVNDGWTDEEIEKAAFKTKEWTDIPQVVTKRNTDDSVTHPKHYTSHPSGIECIQVTEHMNFCRGNAVKYVWRAGEKGDEIEDLKKARWYLDREIARLEKAKEQK